MVISYGRRRIDVLSEDANRLSRFLQGLAAGSAENEGRAQAARDLWPTVIDHALGYAVQSHCPYRDIRWGVWAAAALLPDPLSWTRGLYSEVSGSHIEWIKAEDILGFIDKWVSLGRFETKCVHALIRILRKLQLGEQVSLPCRRCDPGCVAGIRNHPGLRQWSRPSQSPTGSIGGRPGRASS